MPPSFTSPIEPSERTSLPSSQPATAILPSVSGTDVSVEGYGFTNASKRDLIDHLAGFLVAQIVGGH
jgi:hypothetical protein